MTRSSAIWANDVEANDLGDDKPTSSRASTSLPFDDTRDDEDDDDNEEDFFDVETGWTYYRYDAKITFARLSPTVITLFPVPPTSYRYNT
eukprot:scaffold17957_cov57-Attheya_sp.AAC.3